MKKRVHPRILTAAVAVIGAYHVALLALHPKLPPVAKAEVVWGNRSSAQPAHLESPLIADSFCSTVPAQGEEEKAGSPAKSVDDRIRFEYRPVADEIVNTGTAVQVLMGKGSSVEIDGRYYGLDRFMFLKRAADAGGAATPFALYLVHHGKDGTEAVVTVPLRLGGAENPVLDALWRYLPEPGQHNWLGEIHVDLNRLLPRDRTYYRYTNTAATDSCGNKVIWLGLQSPVTLSSAQLAALKQAFDSKRAPAAI